jgi:hypothetical protein
VPQQNVIVHPAENVMSRLLEQKRRHMSGFMHAISFTKRVEHPTPSAEVIGDHILDVQLSLD